MATRRIDAAQLAKRTLRRLKVCVALLCAGAFVLAVVAYSWLFSWMCDFGFSTSALNLLAWGGLATISCITVLGAIHFADEERLYPLMKANLLAAFPEQRKDLDAWLATELYAPDGEATWKLINRRLRERLDPDRPVSLKRKPVRPLLILLPGLLLVVAAAAPGPSRQALQDYGRRLVLGHDSRPLQVVSINPSKTWVVRGEPLQLDLLFDRTVEGAVEVVGVSDDWRLTMDRTAPKAYSIKIPTDRDELRFTVEAEDLKTDVLSFDVLPAQPVMLQTMSLITAAGQVRDVVLHDGFPANAKAGDLARFSMTVAPGPWVIFGLGSRKHGEVPLTRIDRGHAYTGEVTLVESDTFFFFWQLPGRDIERGPDLTVSCTPNQPPVATILLPRNEAVYDEEPVTIDVSYRVRDDGGIDFAWLMVTDYFNLTKRIDLETGARSAEISGNVIVPMADFKTRQGRVLGICLVARDSSKKRLIGTSEPVNVILPGGTLNPENKERMRIFWEQALGRDTDKGSEDAIKKLDRAAGNEEKPGEGKTDSADNGGGKSTGDGPKQADNPEAGKGNGENGSSSSETGETAKGDNAGTKNGGEEPKAGNADSGKNKGTCSACGKTCDNPGSKCASCQGSGGSGTGKQAGDSSKGGSGKNGGEGEQAGDSSKGGSGKNGGESEQAGDSSKGASGKNGGGKGEQGQTDTASNGSEGKGSASGNSKSGQETSSVGGQTTAGNAGNGGTPGNPSLENVSKRPDENATNGKKPGEKNPHEAFSSTKGGITTGDGRKGKTFEGDVDLGKQDGQGDTVESSAATQADPAGGDGDTTKPLPDRLAAERLNVSGQASVPAMDDLAKTYEHVLKKLTPEERRRLLDYYRYLRDVEKKSR